MFQLRDCPTAQEMVFADQDALFPLERAAGCLRFELGTCLGPCAGACTHASYNAKVRAAKAFLLGQDLAPLLHLQRAMQDAAAQQQYERAMVLRDKFKALDWLNRQLEHVRGAKTMSAVVYPLRGHDRVWRWYLLHGGRAVAVLLPAGQSLSELARTDRVSELIALARARSRGWRPADWIANVLLLAAWFARFPAERAALMPLPSSGTSCSGYEQPLE